MRSLASPPRHGDGRLWAIALALSLVVNSGIILIVGVASLRSSVLRKAHPVSPPVPAMTTVTIFEAPAAEPSTTPVASPPGKPAFARTSVDQTASSPEKSAFIGERDTQATSDRSPVLTAPPLPSQAGREPDTRQDLETTESDYQDGSLTGDQPAKPQPPTPVAPDDSSVSDPSLAIHSPAGEKVETPGNDDVRTVPPPRDRLMDGPHPVDVPVPRNVETPAKINPSAPTRPKAGTPVPIASDAPRPTVPKPAAEPGFRGYQRKTAIIGSISRTGRSALDVADSPLGRYQATISRAVEQEWQRNCVRHRDFITPGYLTVRFFVETSGRVRTVRFVGDMETGEVQKGFTLNSIRDAEIPAMPAVLKKDFDKEPLELIFNFYF